MIPYCNITPDVFGPLPKKIQLTVRGGLNLYGQPDRKISAFILGTPQIINQYHDHYMRFEVY